MSLSSTSSADAALLVRDVDGQYRPARAEEVLSQARRVLSHRVRRGATMSSPQAVKNHLRLEIGMLEHEVFCVLLRAGCRHEKGQQTSVARGACCHSGTARKVLT